MVKILWQHIFGEKLVYVDFAIDGIDGVFRCASQKGVDLEEKMSHILKNMVFFRHVVELSASTILEEATPWTNFGNGWEWQESKHDKQPKSYRVDSCVSWFTRPFGQASPNIKPMDQIHNIQTQGIKLLHSFDPNSRPSMVCYFFPCSAPAECAL